MWQICISYSSTCVVWHNSICYTDYSICSVSAVRACGWIPLRIESSDRRGSGMRCMLSLFKKHQLYAVHIPLCLSGLMQATPCPVWGGKISGKFSDLNFSGKFSSLTITTVSIILLSNIQPDLLPFSFLPPFPRSFFHFLLATLRTSFLKHFSPSFLHFLCHLEYLLGAGGGRGCWRHLLCYWSQQNRDGSFRNESFQVNDSLQGVVNDQLTEEEGIIHLGTICRAVPLLASWTMKHTTPFIPARVRNEYKEWRNDVRM
jgi:hypothetical protein